MATIKQPFSLICCFAICLTACATARHNPAWYGRNPGNMLSYSPQDMVWTVNQAEPALEQTTKQMALGVFSSNLANFDGSSEAIANHIVSLPASELNKMAACLKQIKLEYYARPQDKRTVTRISWPKDFSCQLNNIVHNNIVTIIPDTSEMPEMLSGQLTGEAMRLLVHATLRSLPAVETISIKPIINGTRLNVPFEVGTKYAEIILQAAGFELAEQEDNSVNSLHCLLEASKLDPSSYHRMIYGLKCQIISPDQNLLWQDNAYLIPLLP